MGAYAGISTVECLPSKSGARLLQGAQRNKINHDKFEDRAYLSVSCLFRIDLIPKRKNTEDQNV